MKLTDAQIERIFRRAFLVGREAGRKANGGIGYTKSLNALTKEHPSQLAAHAAYTRAVISEFQKLQTGKK